MTLAWSNCRSYVDWLFDVDLLDTERLDGFTKNSG